MENTPIVWYQHHDAVPKVAGADCTWAVGDWDDTFFCGQTGYVIPIASGRLTISSGKQFKQTLNSNAHVHSIPTDESDLKKFFKTYADVVTNNPWARSIAGTSPATRVPMARSKHLVSKFDAGNIYSNPFILTMDRHWKPEALVVEELDNKKTTNINTLSGYNIVSFPTDRDDIIVPLTLHDERLEGRYCVVHQEEFGDAGKKMIEISMLPRELGRGNNHVVLDLPLGVVPSIVPGAKNDTATNDEQLDDTRSTSSRYNFRSSTVRDGASRSSLAQRSTQSSRPSRR